MRTKEEVLKMSQEELEAFVRGEEKKTQNGDYLVKGDWVTDSRGNRASIAFFGGEEAAKRSLQNLYNCENCWNCTNCRNCTNCTYCENCWNCTNCTNCTNCRENCTNCTNCTNCRENCTNCTNCRNCWDCTKLMNGLFCRGVHLEKLSPSRFFIANVEVTEEEFNTKKEELRI